MSDQDQLIDDIKRCLGRKHTEAPTDAGYLSEADLAAPAYRNISACSATGRAKHPGDARREITGPLTRAMRDKLKRARWRRPLPIAKTDRRTSVRTDHAGQRFRQFFLRGIDKVKAE
jgi:hypothetical protein